MTKIIILIYVIAAVASFIGKQQKKKKLKEAAQNQKGPSPAKRPNPFSQFFQAINPDEAKIEARTNRSDPMAEPKPMGRQPAFKAPDSRPSKGENKPKSFSGNILDQLAEEFGFQFEDKEIKKFSNSEGSLEKPGQKPGKLHNWDPEEERETNWEDEAAIIKEAKNHISPLKKDSTKIWEEKGAKVSHIIKEMQPYDRSSNHKYALLLKKKNALKTAIVTKTILDRPLGW